jgi:hypothetical protein
MSVVAHPAKERYCKFATIAIQLLKDRFNRSVKIAANGGSHDSLNENTKTVHTA